MKYDYETLKECAKAFARVAVNHWWDSGYGNPLFRGAGIDDRARLYIGANPIFKKLKVNAGEIFMLGVGKYGEYSYHAYKRVFSFANVSVDEAVDVVSTVLLDALHFAERFNISPEDFKLLEKYYTRSVSGKFGI